jgi:hypothetical protein
MAMVEESHDAVEPAPSQIIELALEQQQLVHLDETKAQAFLSTSCSDDDHLEGWYLDTGALNHMTGCGNVFSELDRAVQGNVKFNRRQHLWQGHHHFLWAPRRAQGPNRCVLDPTLEELDH